MIHKRLAIRIADGIERNLSANITIRFDCQIDQRLHHLWRVIVPMRQVMPEEIVMIQHRTIRKKNAINKMPRLCFRKMLEYRNLVIAFQCANNQIIILTNKFDFVPVVCIKLDIINAVFNPVIIVNNVMAKITLEIIKIIAHATIQIIIAGTTAQNITPFVTKEPVGTADTIQFIIAFATQQRVITRIGVKNVIALISMQLVIAIAAVYLVIAAATKKMIRTISIGVSILRV